MYSVPLIPVGQSFAPSGRIGWAATTQGQLAMHCLAFWRRVGGLALQVCDDVSTETRELSRGVSDPQ